MLARLFLSYFAVGCLVFFLVGCSGGTVGPRVKGQVLLDGKGVSKAHVMFHGKGGTTTFTDEEGKFYLDGTTYKSVQPGKYVVRITRYVDKKSGQPVDAEDYGMLVASGKVKNTVPERYGAEEENPLTADIKEGLNELPPFQLKSK
jgi:hypothetical protein